MGSGAEQMMNWFLRLVLYRRGVVGQNKRSNGFKEWYYRIGAVGQNK